MLTSLGPPAGIFFIQLFITKKIMTEDIQGGSLPTIDLNTLTLDGIKEMQRREQRLSLIALWDSQNEAHKGIVEALAGEESMQDIYVHGEGIYESRTEWGMAPTSLAELAANVINGSARRTTTHSNTNISRGSSCPVMTLANDPTHW
jgi:hypothetical protein